MVFAVCTATLLGAGYIVFSETSGDEQKAVAPAVAFLSEGVNPDAVIIPGDEKVKQGVSMIKELTERLAADPALGEKDKVYENTVVFETESPQSDVFQNDPLPVYTPTTEFISPGSSTTITTTQTSVASTTTDRSVPAHVGTTTIESSTPAAEEKSNSTTTPGT